MLKLEDLTDLTDDEFMDHNYITVLQEKESDEIEELDMQVNQGITRFTLMGGVLIRRYPNLKKLTIHQNYSHGSYATIDKFIDFLEGLKLEYFCLEDYQSEFITRLDVNKIFNVMIDWSTCIFNIHHNIISKQNINDDVIINVKKNGNFTQTFIYTKGNKSILIVQTI